MFPHNPLPPTPGGRTPMVATVSTPLCCTEPSQNHHWPISPHEARSQGATPPRGGLLTGTTLGGGLHCSCTHKKTTIFMFEALHIISFHKIYICSNKKGCTVSYLIYYAYYIIYNIIIIIIYNIYIYNILDYYIDCIAYQCRVDYNC